MTVCQIEQVHNRIHPLLMSKHVHFPALSVLIMAQYLPPNQWYLYCHMQSFNSTFLIVSILTPTTQVRTHLIKCEDY